MSGNEYIDWKNFGTRVKDSRKRLGLTVEKLAEKSDRTENYINRIESGKKSCSIHTLYQFSKAMKVSSDTLLFGEEMEDKEYPDREIINNLLDRCDEKQLKVIKDVLVAICPNFEDLKN